MRGLVIVLVLGVTIDAATVNARTLAYVLCGNVVQIDGVAPPGGIQVGDPAMLRFSYDADSTSAIVSCPTGGIYGFTAGGGLLQADIKSFHLQRAMVFLNVQDGVACPVSDYCQGDAFVAATDSVYPTMSVEFLDCSAPYNMVTSSSLPSDYSQLDFTDNTAAFWEIDFEESAIHVQIDCAQSVSAKTWTQLKSLFR